MSRPLALTDADRLAWAEMESKSRRAALEYAAHPSAVTTALGPCLTCACGRRTYHDSGRCKTCREES